MITRFRLTLILAAATACAGLAAEPSSRTLAVARDAGSVTAVRAVDFLNSVGVNCGISMRGENLQNTIQCASYLGIRWIRSGYESDVPVQDLIRLHEKTGVRFSYGLLSGGTDIPRLLDGAKQLAAAGALLALEGPNEPNNWGITYRGEKGGAGKSWLPVAKLQRALYKAVKSDPALKDYPVWSLSESGAETDNVGLQFLTIPNGAGTLMPDGTPYADYANCHNYLCHPSWPGLHDNEAWNAADPTSACKVDGLYGNYGKTWAKKFPGCSEAELVRLPKVTTETGRPIAEGDTSEEQQACLFLDFYLAQFKRGWSHTAVYLLRDRVDETGNQRFGFFKPDYSPRKSAVCLHNLTTILADNGAIPVPGKLNYAIPNQPETVHDLLLQKSGGQFELVVWNERFVSKDEDKVMVNLGHTLQTVKIFDPTIDTAATGTLSNVGSVSLSLSGHPMIIELAPGK